MIIRDVALSGRANPRCGHGNILRSVSWGSLSANFILWINGLTVTKTKAGKERVNGKVLLSKVESLMALFSVLTNLDRGF